MSESTEETSARRRREHLDKVGAWFAGQAQGLYQRYHTLVTDHPECAPGSLWLLRAIPITGERRAQIQAADPDAVDPRETTAVEFKAFVTADTLRDEGVCDSLIAIAQIVAQHRLAHDGAVPDRLGLDPLGMVLGTALSLVETRAGTGDRYQSVYLATVSGDAAIRRTAIDAAGRAGRTDAHHALLPDADTMETGVANGTFHPYLRHLMMLTAALALDVDTLREGQVTGAIEALTEALLGGLYAPAGDSRAAHPFDPIVRLN